MEPDSTLQPRLRPLEILPVSVQGRPMFALRDPLGLAEGVALVERETGILLGLMDGKNTLRDIQAEVMRRTGELVYLDRIAELVDQLDRQFLLDSDAFRQRQAQVAAEYRGADCRQAYHAGQAYPGDAGELAALLESLLASAPPPPEPLPPPGSLVGLVAPHIDLERGGQGFAAAYAELRRHPPYQLYVLLGTAHAGISHPFAATGKSYATPLGTIPTDVELVTSLGERCQRELGWDLFADELVHRTEHSLEFQMLFLRHLLPADARASAVPLLCGPLSAVYETTPDSSAARASVERFLQCLRELLGASGRRFCVIAGADLAHVGERFGDPAPVPPAQLAATAAEDRQFLRHVELNEPEALAQHMERFGVRRHVCSFGQLYALLRLCPSATGTLLHYGQWVEPGNRATVSFAALGLYR